MAYPTVSKITTPEQALVVKKYVEGIGFPVYAFGIEDHSQFGPPRPSCVVVDIATAAAGVPQEFNVILEDPKVSPMTSLYNNCASILDLMTKPLSVYGTERNRALWVYGGITGSYDPKEFAIHLQETVAVSESIETILARLQA